MLTAGQIIDPIRIRDWGRIINSKAFKDRLFSKPFSKGPNIDGLDIYYIKYGNDEYELFAFDNNSFANNIVYYCQIRSNSTRNNLFKPGIGFSTSGVWRDPFLNKKAFALTVYDEFILEKLIDKCIITDLMQTVYGINPFSRLASLALAKHWKLYAGFSAPKDARAVVALTAREFQDHIDDIFNYATAYSYRCAFLLKPTIRLKSILNIPSKTLILTCSEAEDLGLFIKLDDLDDDYLTLRDEEINRRAKHAK